MQSWTRQPTACLFCQFRQSLSRHNRPRPDGRIRASREYTSTSVAPSKDRKGRGSRARSDENDEQDDKRVWKGKGTRRLLLKDSPRQGRDKDEKYVGSLPIRRTHLAPGLDREKRANLVRSFVKVALPALEKRLSIEPEVEKDAAKLPSLMQRLDPDHKFWPRFSKRVLALNENPGDAGDDAEKNLLNRLKVAASRGREEVERELYYEFLDDALKPVTRDPSTSMPIDLRYPTEWYSSARTQQRTIHLHVGPTNSGKTYNALKRLQESKNGFYAGPLRLLAHEVYSRFRANGIACDLITGDDVRLDDDMDTKVYASTVEMVQTGKELEVAVIDEIQMMGNEERGWAWTRAFLGANAKEVHLCGEARVVPLIRELAASMGDTLHIHHYERLNPLRVTTKSLRGNLKGLRKGDCIVAFSIMQIHALKKQIEVETGRRCAIVYGSLPPETRAEQADFFNNPDNDYDYLVASDAIGMGLNLSVKRIIFNSVHKFDGVQRVQLTVPQIKQIAGRAGRYRSAHEDKSKSTVVKDPNAEENVGLVTCLDEADLPIIEAALRTEPPPLRRAGILPPAEFLEEYSQRLPITVPFEYLMRKVSAMATLHPRFFQCDIRDKLALARITDDVRGLSIEQRVNITAAPSPGRNPALAKCLKALAKVIAEQRSVDVSEIPEIPLETLATTPTADRTYLESLEALHQCLILYLWLSYRFTTSLRDRDMAMHAKHLIEQKINWTLRAFSANPKLRERLRQIRETQQDLVEGHFSTQPPSEGQTETNTHEAQPDHPAEAYEDQDADTPKGSETIEPFPRLEEFGDGEAGLDIGRELGLSQELARTSAYKHQQAAVTDQSPEDAVLGGESILDIAPPRPFVSEQDHTPSHTDEYTSDSEALMRPVEKHSVDTELQNEKVLEPDSADSTVASEDNSTGPETDDEMPTAKGKQGEVLDPEALNEEIVEGEKLRGSAGG